MSFQRKKPRTLSTGTRKYLQIIDRYVAETGNKLPDLHDVAAWAYREGIAEPRHADVVKQIARELARAARQDFLTDENGEPVRRRHAFKEHRGGKQLTFWFLMEDATPEQMRLSAIGRRNGSLMDILQLDRDVTYFNKHHNPGDPIEMDFNFSPDVEERHLPTEYPDKPESENNQGDETQDS